MQQPAWVPNETGNVATWSVTSLLHFGDNGVIPLSSRPYPDGQQETRMDNEKEKKKKERGHENRTIQKEMGNP